MEPIIEAVTAPLEAVGEVIGEVVPEIPEISFGPPAPEIMALTGEAAASSLSDAALHPEYLDPYLYDRFTIMRDTVHYTQSLELDYRVSINPQMTELERAMGCSVEMLEPQVRDAALTMWDKGYSTYSSGFYGQGHNLQVIDGVFKVDATLAESLYTKFGVKTENVGNHTSLFFWMHPADTMESVTAKWNAIAEFLPDLGKPSTPNTMDGADLFRQSFFTPNIVTAEMTATIQEFGDQPTTDSVTVGGAETLPAIIGERYVNVSAGLGFFCLAMSMNAIEAIDDDNKKQKVN